MIKITLPDGAQKNLKKPIDGFTIARTISEGFAGNCVAMELHGKLVDMHHVISSDAADTVYHQKGP
jgi:threonyl-tRNA synthetase